MRHMLRHQTSLLVLQPTPFCNISCTYCYLPDRDARNRMSPHTVKAAIYNLRDSGLLRDPLSLVWHAGEPLAVGITHFSALVEAAELAATDVGVKCRQSIQTNGTLIDDEMCHMFQKYSIRVGVSCDGIQQLHDQNRRTRAGATTHQSVMNGIANLKVFGIPFYVITVLTRNHLSMCDDLFEFYRTHGITEVAFNIEEIEGVNGKSSLAEPENSTRKQVTNFIRQFSELSQRCGGIRIRELDDTQRRILHAPLSERSPLTIPFDLVTVSWNGDWSTYSPELLGASHPSLGSLVFGNVLHGRISDSFNDQRFCDIYDEISRGVERCAANCDYYCVCGGGAPSNKLAEHATFDVAETMFCTLHRKAMVDAIMPMCDPSFIDTKHQA